jgi:hypothetical protein
MEQHKTKMIRSKKMREGARGQTCTMQLVGICNNDPSTTVFAHSDHWMHGKALGSKAHDIFGADMCYACHTEYHKDELKYFHDFVRAMARTQLRRIEQGIITVK